LPDAILVDSLKPGEYGGTGEVADWEAVSNARAGLGEIPLVLAGGLTPFNVADAIAKVRPDAVDTASGVESRPANKDPMLVRAFVNAAKKAFQQLESETS
jgi:phosphoribosylanthranilate isomerase